MCTAFLVSKLALLALLASPRGTSCEEAGEEAPRRRRAPPETINVSGYVKIADKMFRATCNCPSHIRSLEEMVYRSKTLCRPSKVKVRTHNVQGPPDAELVASFKHLPPGDFVYIAGQSFAAMDGRSSARSFFCPGGDLGMLIEVLLNMFENTDRLSEAVIADLIREYLKTLPPEATFHHSTDQAALDGMCKSLQWDVIDLSNVNEVNQNKVKNALLENLGDHYLKYLLELYRNNTVKNRILVWSLWAFFSVLWDKSDAASERLELEVLAGQYDPQLLMEISVNHGCEIYGVFPRVESRVGGRQLLVFSEYAAKVRRAELSAFVFKHFTDQFSYDFSLPLDQYLIQLNKNGYILMENFILRYVNKMPFYNMTYI